MAAPTQPPAPPAVSTIPITTQPSAGWRSSEAWLTLIAVILGALPSSGLISGSPLAAKLVGMAIAALSVLGYQAQRTSLKRAHLAAATTQAAVAPTSRIPAGVSAALAIGTAVLLAWGCTTSTGTKTPIGQGGDAFLHCEKVNLSQDVGGSSLLATVANDLVGGNYQEAIANLIVRLSSEAVGCAVLAVDTVVEAGKTSGAAALSPIELRARELIKKYNWTASPGSQSQPPALPPHASLDLPTCLTITANSADIDRCAGLATIPNPKAYASVEIQL